MSDPILDCQNLSKTFDEGKLKVEVLKKIDLKAFPGETLAILGRSGSGKSTLLHLLGGLDQPGQGKVLLNGQDLYALPEVRRCELRRRFLGFVYQFHHLLPEFSALENVSMPLLLGDLNLSEVSQRAKNLLEKVGLSHRLEHHVSELSGGERQRVAIARALINQPACLMADEPTGNLDKSTAEEIFQLLLDLNRELSTTLIVVTHDLRLAENLQRKLSLEEGQLKEI